MWVKDGESAGFSLRNHRAFVTILQLNPASDKRLFSSEAVKSEGGELMKAYELLYFVAPSIDEEIGRASCRERV